MSNVIDHPNPSEQEQIKLIEENDKFIAYIPRPTMKAQLLAISIDPFLIGYIGFPCLEAQLAAVRANKNTLKFIVNPFEQVKTLAQEMPDTEFVIEDEVLRIIDFYSNDNDKVYKYSKYNDTQKKNEIDDELSYKLRFASTIRTPFSWIYRKSILPYIYFKNIDRNSKQFQQLKTKPNSWKCRNEDIVISSEERFEMKYHNLFLEERPFVNCKDNLDLFLKTRFTVVKTGLRGQTAIQYLEANPDFDYNFNRFFGTTTEPPQINSHFPDIFYSTPVIPNKVWRHMLHKPDGDNLFSPIPDISYYERGHVVPIFKSTFNKENRQWEYNLTLLYVKEAWYPPISIFNGTLPEVNFQLYVNPLSVREFECKCIENDLTIYSFWLGSVRDEFYFYFDEEIEESAQVSVEIPDVKFKLTKIKYSTYKVHSFETELSHLKTSDFHPDIAGENHINFWKVDYMKINIKNGKKNLGKVTVFGKYFNTFQYSGNLSRTIYHSE